MCEKLVNLVSEKYETVVYSDTARNKEGMPFQAAA